MLNRRKGLILAFCSDLLKQRRRLGFRQACALASHELTDKATDPAMRATLQLGQHLADVGILRRLAQFLKRVCTVPPRGRFPLIGGSLSGESLSLAGPCENIIFGLQSRTQPHFNPRSFSLPFLYSRYARSPGLQRLEEQGTT